MRILYLTASGASDATRASIPVHLAVNGSLEAGQDVGVMLAGDATEFLKADAREQAEGIGLPPMREPWKAEALRKCWCHALAWWLMAAQ